MAKRSKAALGLAAGPRLRGSRALETRARIQAAALVNRLQAHALGELDMSHTQVRAIECLLRKVLPDLQAAEIHHYDETQHATEAELVDRLRATLAALPPELRALVLLGIAGPSVTGASEPPQ